MRRSSHQRVHALALAVIAAMTLGRSHVLGADNDQVLSRIPCSNAEVLAGLSPFNWVVQPEGVSTTVGGASVCVQFEGTSVVQLRVDTHGITGMSPHRYPVIAWSVAGGEMQVHQIVADETAIVLSDQRRNPRIELYCRGFSPFEDRYAGDVPVNALRITGFAVEHGGKVVPAGLPRKIWLNIGDSIMAGDAALVQGRPADDLWAIADDARASYGYLLASHYGYREARIAYGGYDWGGGMAGLPNLATLIDQKTSTISRLTNGTLRPPPAIVLINLGENGAPAEADVVKALSAVRQCAGAAARILVTIPLSQRAHDEVSRAFAKYQDVAKDDHAQLIDLGQFTFDTADGQHPTSAGHRTIFQKAVPYLDAIITTIP